MVPTPTHSMRTPKRAQPPVAVERQRKPGRDRAVLDFAGARSGYSLPLLTVPQPERII